jgi:AraC-like DNA-binding protein
VWIPAETLHQIEMTGSVGMRTLYLALSSQAGCRSAVGAGSIRDRSALAVGYQSTSAFIAAFKRELGVTPSEYHR